MSETGSKITKPIILNETGEAIRAAIDKQTGYLAMIAEGKRAELYTSMTQIASIVRGSTLEQISQLFPIGDQIIAPWKDMDDSSHNTDETAYQVAWNIVNHGMVTLRDGSEVPGLWLQMDKCSAYGVQFSHQEAFLNCPDGLAAGTYHVTLGDTWGSKEATAGTSWQFTLAKAVPAGGRLSGFESMPDVAATSWCVKSWATPADADPIETVTVTAGEGGTDLGTMMLTTAGEDGLNCMQRVGYGSNRWSTSALRQYLNKSGDNWWTSQTDFDIRPDQHAKKGFMTGFDAEFLSAIKPVKVTSALNTVDGYDTTYEDTYDTFFLPSLQQMNIKPQLADVEGEYWPYWRSRMGLNRYINYGWESEPNKNDGLLIPAINSNSPQSVRLRSAYRGNANIPWCVSPSGYVSNGGPASFAFRSSPVCVIC